MTDTSPPGYENEQLDALDYGYKFVKVVTRYHEWNFRTQEYEKEVTMEHWQKVLFEGQVLTTRERNYYDDSDFYCVYFDPKKKEMGQYEYATTRFGGGGHCSVDATDEVKRGAANWLIQWFFDELKKSAWSKARKIDVESIVRVKSGRKVPKGTVGLVQWYGRGRSFKGYGEGPMRARIEANDKGHTEYWIDAKHLEIIDPEQFEPTDDELAERAARIADNCYEQNSGWHYPFATGRGMIVI